MKILSPEMEDEELGRFLNAYFDKEEVNTLCFDLGIDYTRFNGRTLTERIQEVLALFAEQGRRPELMAQIREKRPALFGVKTQQSGVEPPGEFPRPDEIKELDRKALRDLLVEQFNYKQMQTICKALQVDEGKLSRKTMPSMARDLIVYLEKQERLSDLRERLIQHSLGNDPIYPQMVEPLDKIAPANPFIAAMYEHFDERDFLSLYKSLRIDPEDLADDSGITGFVNYLNRRGRIPELVKVLTDLEPAVSWQEVATTLDAPPPASSPLAEKIAFHFDLSEFLTICFDFGIKEDNLPGDNYLEMIEDMISVLGGRGKTGELLGYLKRERPHLSWSG